LIERRVTRLSNGQLFTGAVLVWGTTWYAIVHQLAVASPEFGVTVRFALAAVLVCGVAAWRGERLRLPARAHPWLALQGAFLYSLSYLCVYHAEKHVPSGLVAVGYSAAPLLAGVGAWALWRAPLGGRFVAGGVLGVLGVALIFWPEIAHTRARPTALLGLLFTASAVLLSAVGSLASAHLARSQTLPFWSSMGLSMGYGALLSLLWLLLSGQTLPALSILSSPLWWATLLYLSVAGTVLAFAAFLTLQQRVGPGRAATVGVMTPVLALAVSAAFENFVPDLYTAAGVLLAVWGNVWMLRTRQATVKPPAAAAAG
jgi:drug/metabolite transporter (DMT)-like permease